MKKIFTILLAATLYSFANPNELKEKGLLAFNDNFYSASTEYFSKYLDVLPKKNPLYAKGTILLIKSLVQEKRFNDASKVIKNYSALLLPIKDKIVQQEMEFWTAYLSFKQKNFVDSERILNAIIKQPMSSKLQIQANAALGESYFMQKKFNETIRVYTTLTNKFSQSKEAQFAAVELVKLFVLKKDFFWAERQIAKLMANNDPKVKEKATLLSILIFCLKADDQSALENYEKLYNTTKPSKRDSEWFVVSYYLGELLFDKKNYAASSSTFSHALTFASSRKNYQNVLLKLALAYSNNNDNKLAIETYKEFLELYGDNKLYPQVVFALATVYKKEKNYKDAITQLKTVIKSDKYDNNIKFDAHMMVADCYTKSKQTSLAIEEYLTAKKMATRDKDKAKSLFLAAEEAYKDHKYDVAASLYQQVADDFQESSFAERARFYQAITYAKDKKFAEAEKIFDIFLKEYPGNSLIEAVIFQKAVVIKQQKKFVEAIPVFADLYLHYPQSRNALQAILLAVECMSAVGKNDEAVSLLKNALVTYKDDELHPYVYSRLFQLYMVMNNSSDAIKISDEFMKKYSDSKLAPEVIMGLADYYANSRDYVKATRFYEMLSTKFPKHKWASLAMYESAQATRHFSVEKSLSLLNKMVAMKDLTPEWKAEAGLLAGNLLIDKLDYVEALKVLASVNSELIDTNLQFTISGRIADCYFLSGDLEKAIGIYLKLTKQVTNPDLKVQAKFKLAKCYIDSEQKKEAEKELLDIVYQMNVAVNNAQIVDWKYFSRGAFTLVDFYIEEKRIDEAKKILERLTKLPFALSKVAEQRLKAL